jgi:hypothetical protein
MNFREPTETTTGFDAIGLTAGDYTPRDCMSAAGIHKLVTTCWPLAPPLFDTVRITHSGVFGMNRQMRVSVARSASNLVAINQICEGT